MTTVIATDGSELAKRAVDAGLDLAKATGDTVGAVVRKYRLAAARDDLVHTNLSIAAIAHRWGFCDASHLGREFRRYLSLSPGDYREAHGTPRSSEVGIAI